MKSNKVCAILGNISEFNGLGQLVVERPLATLPFGAKYRLIDFQLSSIANANIRNVYTVFRYNEIHSVFDHIGSGKEWGLDTLLNRYFLGFYEDVQLRKDRGEDYYAQMIDYLVKSKSDQTVFLSSNMLANVDLRTLIQVHKNQGKKLTVAYKKYSPAQMSTNNTILEICDNSVVGTHYFNPEVDTEDRVNLNMGLFMVETDWLINQLRGAYKTNAPISLQYFLSEQLGKEDTATYEYTGYLSNIFDVKSYYEANMDMLDPAIFNALFFSNNKVYTKVKNEAPTYYSKDSHVRSSQFASGSIIEGTVENSIISRMVVVAKDATVKGSIVMPGGKIKSGAIVEYAILDKNVIVEDGVIIQGTQENPVVIKKGSVITENIIGNAPVIVGGI
ncbi:MAG: glucose-1-phosphate adenylyltransferase subunit GlgD [Lactobacillales bacterium]|jgi:glucose-1-phosphate adenylyltransferase|nr:glucose-1-phosphate adenylyltransferase subunit GlgD [Lactobacillales bacterium]